MIVGIGVDLVSIERFKRWTTNARMLDRFFSEEEISYARHSRDMAESLAGAFAAKEAFGKVLGIGLFGLTLKDICVGHTRRGQPELILRGSALRALRDSDADSVHVSIAHEGSYAVAVAVAERSSEYAKGKEQEG